MRRKEQAEASRAGLLEAARRCFTEQGYEATTVSAILDRAGMARGALYHYFPGGKREIFAAVFELVDEAFHDRRDALFALDSPLARIRAGIRLFLDLCVEDDFARIILIDAPEIFPGQADRGSSYALLHAQLKEATATGEVRSFQPEVMAAALYGAVRRAGEVVISAPDRPQAADQAAQALDVLLDGLAAKAPSP
ncbi:TetR/AcrR family transcriptional regulator [Actinomadura sp. 9N215]|uniref:TetR/AcrR family transcriptional regulator n=1 Tax=Actinomadura sp. 9N215 TaxID=3375150 RepID=UPI0037B6464C